MGALTARPVVMSVPNIPPTASPGVAGIKKAEKNRIFIDSEPKKTQNQLKFKHIF